jgi:hypothetical protein
VIPVVPRTQSLPCADSAIANAFREALERDKHSRRIMDLVRVGENLLDYIWNVRILESLPPRSIEPQVVVQ